MGKLKGKVALISGASKGIGAAIAKEMAAEGASVVLTYSSDQEGGEAVENAIRTEGGTAVAFRLNVADEDDVTRTFKKAIDAFGRVDILVNNAGVYKAHPIEEVNEAEYRREFDTNVLGTLLMIKAAVAHFGEAGGSIVNLGSVNSVGAQAGMVVYSATKGAVDTITRSLAVELASRKIRVNTLAPGPTETEGIHSAGVFGSPFEQHIIDRTPLGRFGRPDDIAKVAVFLASDDAGWITGERLAVSGGFRPN